MALKLVTISLVLSGVRALGATFDIIVSPQGIFNNTILPPSTNLTPIPYKLFATGVNGSEFILYEFNDILRNTSETFTGIFWGSVLPNVTEIGLDLPKGGEILNKAENYSPTCSNASTIFSSTLIFSNCLLLGTTSVLLDSGLISLDEDSVGIAESSLHFGDMHSFNGSGVLDNIATCISATCQNTSTSICSRDVTSNLTEAHDLSQNVTEKLKRLFMGFNAYCDDQTVIPNSDVLGPGVLVASLTQYAAILFFFLASKFRRWACHLKDWHQKPWIWGDEEADAPALGPQVDPNRKPGGLARGIARGLARFSTAIESVFVEFHEAQIFFVLTIQIAYFWFFNPEKLKKDSKTYAEAYATFYWAAATSTYVVMPVNLGQTVLQRSGRHWWYTTFLTTTASILLCVLGKNPTEINYAAFWEKFKRDDPVRRQPKSDDLLWSFSKCEHIRP